MHDDDWFRTPKSLQRFADKTTERKKFIFSRYYNVFENGREELPHFPFSWKKRIISEPVTLLAENVIGPPSVTMVHHSIKEQYDARMKWRVDLDFYIRVLQQEKEFALIDEPLVNVGIGSTQVTNDCINVPEVELTEGLLLLKKYGLHPLRTLRVYDAWWRVLRNTSTRSLQQLQQFTPQEQWPEVIQRMVLQQQKLPPTMLQNGLFSKSLMFLSYLQNQKLLRGA